MSKSSFFSKQQLQQLKQMQKTVPAQPQESVATPEEPSDEALFLQAMQGVTPLKSNQTAHITRPIKKPDAQILAKRLNAEGSAFDEQNALLSDTHAILNPVASQAFLSYRIATLQHRVFDDLKAGRLRWFEAVDLHGCTVDQARDAVLQLIQIAQQQQQNVVKIVHGKGKDAILKSCVNSWLQQHPQVLAFVSAPENQGGTGAVLVLLKKVHSETAQT